MRIAQRNNIVRYSTPAQPLWEVLSTLGLSIGVVDGYRLSFPAMRVTDKNSYFLSYGMGMYYRKYSPNSHDEGLGQLGMFVQPADIFEKISGHLFEEKFEWQPAVLLKLIKDSKQPDFINMFVDQPDKIQHRYWKWYQPQYYLNVKADDVERYQDKIPKFYRDFDRWIGKLITEADPRSVIIIISDHGHSPCFLHLDFYTQHRHGPPGIIIMHGEPIRKNFKIQNAHILDICSTVYYLLGLPVPDDSDGRVLTETMDKKFISEYPVSKIASYDFLKEEFTGETEFPLDKEELEKLKSLGYIK
jgi:predicted AlkP superfamily phosphohydrolase/phosphomutase